MIVRNMLIFVNFSISSELNVVIVKSTARRRTKKMTEYGRSYLYFVIFVNFIVWRTSAATTQAKWRLENALHVEIMSVSV